MTDHSTTRFLSNPEGDTDPSETAEWRDAFVALVATQGPQRARFVLDALVRLARATQVDWSPELVTPYVNSIPVDKQPAFPGDLAIEEKLGSLMRWNALAMVARANGAAQDPAIRQFRSMIARAKASVSVSPAMLAQLAGQARNLLTR